MSGRLFIIATPIGNLGDLTLRAREALSESDLILAEDTRVTIKLLNHLGLKKKMVSCHDFNEAKRASLLVEVADGNGTVALVSDAGTPLVSDPGFQIVKKAIAVGMQVIPIAGPSAFLLALVGSGLPCDRFAFEGFLPDRLRDRRKHLEQLKVDARTLVFYVSPHDLVSILEELNSTLGDRAACLAREITKLHEEFVRATLSELSAQAKARKFRGECVVVVAGAPRGEKLRAGRDSALKDLALALDRGEHLKDACAVLAESTGWSKSELYKLGIEYLNRQKDPDVRD